MQSRSRPVPLLALALALLCTDACTDARTNAKETKAPPAPPVVPQPAPLALPIAVDGMIDLTGDDLVPTLRKAGGKGVLVNLWASWCGSCKAEVPVLTDLIAGLEGSGLSLLLISADRSPDRAKAAAFLRERNLPLPGYLLAGKVNAFIRAINPRWDGGIPATFLFDSEARLRFYWAGPVQAHEVLPVLQGFLAGEAIDGEFIPPLSHGKAR
jgi:thiol-disulfide isomerase/thioredoxin